MSSEKRAGSVSDRSLLKKKRPSTNWYDYPQYFDWAFADETKLEADFIEAAGRKFASGSVRRLLEPGCGGGRLVAELARRGYQVLGFDNNPRMLAYVGKRIRRGKLSAEVYHGDMADFQVVPPVDVVYNTFNTFRHLTTETLAVAHLRCAAQALRTGGILILGFHLLPPDASLECIERWTASRGGTKVHYTLRVVESSRRARLEHIKISMLVRTPRQEIPLADEFPLRLYNAAQVRTLLDQVPELELCDVFNFDYDIERPQPLDDELSDAVFVLRKR